MNSTELTNTTAIIRWFKQTYGIKTLLSDERIAIEYHLQHPKSNIIKLALGKTKQYVTKVPQKLLSLFKLFKKD